MSVGAGGSDRVRSALRLPAADRLAAVERFFTAHPHGRAPLGLGRAVADFVVWQQRSGRLADDTGSPWWRCVNGVMVLDLTAAAEAAAPEHRPPATGSAAAWVEYARGDAGGAQARLWDAHQESLAEGLRLAEPMLAHEPAAERAFTEIVVAVVDHSAAERYPTATADLAELTARRYPKRYPASDATVSALWAKLAPLLAGVAGADRSASGGT